MAGQSLLSRWRRFSTSFDRIDAAIEAADPSVSRDEFRRLRAQIVEMLCTAEDDGRKAEGLCMILDKVMAESLVTLQSVPADVVPRLLASSADLANAVGALRSHDSGRVCGLARDLIYGWKASVEGDIVQMTAAIAQLDVLSQLPPSVSRKSRDRSDKAPSNPGAKKDQPNHPVCPKKVTSLVVDATVGATGPRKTAPDGGTSRAMMTDKQAPPVKMPESMAKKERQPCRPTRTASESTASYHVTDGQSNNLPLPHHEAKKHQAKIQENRPHTKKMAPVAVDGSDRVKASEVCPSTKKTVPRPAERMEVTKRKLHEGYQEVADAKRRRMIQVIEAPKMPEQRQLPIVRERSRERCGGSTAVRLSLMPAFRRT